MTPATDPMNWTAIAAGAVLAFLFGWLVYSPKVFGKGWAEGSGVALGDASEMPKAAMGAQFLALVLLSLVVGITATTSALWTAILAILAAAMFVVSGGLFVKKSSYALRVDALYIIGSGVIMIACQGLL